MGRSDGKHRFYCESEEADAYIIRAFLFGNANGERTIQETIGEARKLMDWIEPNDRSYPTFIQGVTAATCLGWHFAQSDGECEALKEERLVIEKWLRTDNAIGCFKLSTLVILYALLVPAKTRNLRMGLDRQLLVDFASSRALVCVLRIYEFLAKVEDCQHLEVLLQQRYGKDGAAVLHSDDSKTVHSLLRPYMAKVDPDLCSRCDAALEYNVSQVSDDHREHALARITETFNSMLEHGTATESQAKRLYALDKASRRPGGKYMAERTRESLMRWGSAGGAERLGRLRKWDAELRYDESAVARLSKAILDASSSAEDTAAAAALRIGVSSYYSAGDLADCSAFLGSCATWAKELDVHNEQMKRLMGMFPRQADEQTNAISNDKALGSESLPEHERRAREREQETSRLATNALERISYVDPVKDREWDEVAIACSCLVERGRAPEETLTKLATARKLELASCGSWQYHSTALAHLMDAIADFADDDAFFAVLAARKDNLASYGYGSASDDLAYVLNRRAAKRMPSLLADFFDNEFESKKLWLTANGKLPVISYPPEVNEADLPQDLTGLAAQALIDQLVPQNPRMCENALRGLAWGGLAARGIRERAYRLCNSCAANRRIMLYKVFGYWRDMGMDTATINDLYERSLESSTRLDEDSLLCLLLGKPTVECLSTPIASAGTVSSQTGGSYAGRGTTFLGFAERRPGQFEALRAQLAALPATEEDFEAKPFVQSGDTYCPLYVGEAMEEEALYRACAEGEFCDLPSDIATSLLVDPSDVWAIAATPVIHSVEECEVSSLLEALEKDLRVDTSQVRRIAERGLSENERLLSWKVYIPYGRDMEYTTVGTARIDLGTSNKHGANVVDREFGCYGILGKAGGGIRSDFDHGNSVSLCNEVTGSFSLIWGDVELVPDRMLTSFGLEPNGGNPLEWLDSDGSQALRFERCLYIVKDHYERRDAYYRQPQVWRWVCNAELQRTLMLAAGSIIYTSTETANEKDIMKKRVDDWTIEASSSPL